MRYAIISDIHSDYNALFEVVNRINKQNIEKIICLGDIIGYGNEPEKVVNNVMENNIICISGNHERALFDTNAFEFMNDKAKVAIDNNFDVLTEKSLNFLEQLPLVLVESGIRFVHGMPPKSIYKYFHVIDKDEVLKDINSYNENITFCGHSHKIGIMKINHKSIIRKDIIANKKIILEENNRYIINIGSVSLSRENTICNFVIYDSNLNVIEFFNKKA